jgi:hypothetical protein
MKYVVIALVALAAAAVATFVRYESFDPCDWMEQDLTRKSGLPPIIVKGQIRADFILRGIASPGPYECVKAWWRFRANGLPDGK